MQLEAPGTLSATSCISEDTPLHVYLVDYNPTTLERFSRWADDLNITAHAYDSGQKFLNDPNWKEEKGEQIFILHDGLPEVASLEVLSQLLPTNGAKSQRVWLLSHEFNANLRDVTKLAGVSGWLNRPLGKGTLKMLCKSYRRGDIHTPTPSDIINYHIKTGILSLQWKSEQLHLSGVMDEKSHFSRMKWLVPSSHTDITMNCGGLVSLNIEGLKEWFQFANTEWAQERTFNFTACPPMMREFFDAMPELFGTNTQVSIAHTPDEALKPNNQSNPPLTDLAGSVRSLLLSPALKAPQDDQRFVERYIGCLTMIFRCCLSELYLTREGVLDHASRLVARCNGIRRGLIHLETDESFELPKRFPLIPALLELYEPLLTSLAAPTELLQRTNQAITAPSRADEYLGWLEELSQGQDAPVWTRALQDAFQEHQSGDVQPLEFDSPLVVALLGALKDYLSGPLAEVDTTGVQVFQLIKTHTPSTESVEELAKSLRRSKIKEDSLADFRRDTLLSWRPDDSQLTLLARAGAMLRATAHEIQQIVQILDSHDALQQILGHRLTEVELAGPEVNNDALGQKLQQQAVTLLEKKVIGLYFNELAISFDNEVELVGVSLF